MPWHEELPAESVELLHPTPALRFPSRNNPGKPNIQAR